MNPSDTAHLGFTPRVSSIVGSIIKEVRTIRLECDRFTRDREAVGPSVEWQLGRVLYLELRELDLFESDLHGYLDPAARRVSEFLVTRSLGERGSESAALVEVLDEILARREELRAEAAKIAACQVLDEYINEDRARLAALCSRVDAALGALLTGHYDSESRPHFECA